MEKFELFPGGKMLDRVVDAGLWVGRLFTQRHVSVTPSEHFHVVAPPQEPIHLNKYEDGGYDDMGCYYDGTVPDIQGKDLPPAA